MYFTGTPLTAQSHQSSRIPRKARTVPIERGELFGSVYSSVTSRSPEIDASVLAAYGEMIAATNAAAAQATLKNNSLRCSDCVKDKHFEQFPVCRAYPWRHGGRGYYCLECIAKRNLAAKRNKLRGVMIDPVDDAYLRSKKNNRRKAKNLELPARAS